MRDGKTPLAAANNQRVTWHIRPAQDRCYLTFDDGPDREWTPRVLEVLARAGCHATFFAVGRLATEHGSMLREARAAGHAVENHGYGHRHPWTLSPEQALREVGDGADAVAQATGERPGWFRPAHGRLSRSIVGAAAMHGQRIALWTRSAVDWGPFASPQRVLARLATVRAGDIALLHDGPLLHNRPAATLRALPLLLALLARGNLKPAPLPTSLQCGDE